MIIVKCCNKTDKYEYCNKKRVNDTNFFLHDSFYSYFMGSHPEKEIEK